MAGVGFLVTKKPTDRFLSTKKPAAWFLILRASTHQRDSIKSFSYSFFFLFLSSSSFSYLKEEEEEARKLTYENTK